jgi:hypothetical protein
MSASLAVGLTAGVLAVAPVTPNVAPRSVTVEVTLAALGFNEPLRNFNLNYADEFLLYNPEALDDAAYAGPLVPTLELPPANDVHGSTQDHNLLPTCHGDCPQTATLAQSISAFPGYVVTQADRVSSDLKMYFNHSLMMVVYAVVLTAVLYVVMLGELRHTSVAGLADKIATAPTVVEAKARLNGSWGQLKESWAQLKTDVALAFDRQNFVDFALGADVSKEDAAKPETASRSTRSPAARGTAVVYLGPTWPVDVNADPTATQEPSAPAAAEASVASLPSRPTASLASRTRAASVTTRQAPSAKAAAATAETAPTAEPGQRRAARGAEQGRRLARPVTRAVTNVGGCGNGRCGQP